MTAPFAIHNSAVESISRIIASFFYLTTLNLAAWIIYFAFSKVPKTVPNVPRIPPSVLTGSSTLGITFVYLGFLQSGQSVTIEYLTQLMHQYFTLNRYFTIFIIMATFKGVKILVHTFSYYILTRPAVADTPTLFPQDVTVIVPTVGNFDDEFQECIETILFNDPAEVIVSTVGEAKRRQAFEVCNRLFPNRITIVSISEANKRAQFLHATKIVQTEITAYADDHVFWPSTYLKSSLAPFEDNKVGIVGTVKRVIRDRSGGILSSFLNYIACMYLERHNFECTSSYNIDGGVFVISGRTALVRTDIVQSPEYQSEFLNDTWFWGMVGPLKVDDDNFTTRFMVNNGYKTVFHNAPDALMWTTLGTTGGLEKFKGQLIRWARTTWRSNTTSLFKDRVCWYSQPWTTYAMFLSSFVNFTIIYDPLMIYFLYKSGFGHMSTFLVCLFLTKLIKPLPHLLREPKDIVFFFVGILFGYYHSFVKFWAMLTSWNIAWTGRVGIA